ncbi:Mur ligase family protein [Patescibacteria group bacterium]
METIIKILSFLIFAKLFLFWLWLWQLKEYHIGRFIAHFETQVFVKIASSFWRLKHPEFTKKIIVIFLTGLALVAFTTFYSYIFLFVLIVLSPIFCSLWILLFQIPTVILRRRIMRKAAFKRRKFKDLVVVGITGSYGKTSTKEFLYSILADKFGNKVLKTRDHQNSEMGISKCVLDELKPEHQIFVCEMGAYNKGGIKMLCDIVKPKIGILTGINEQHMSTFGSQENIIKAKYELIESLPEDGTALFNEKNKYCVDLYKKTAGLKKFLYGEEAKFFGEENILGAQVVARELGMTEDETCNAVFKIENKFGGIQKKKGINEINIVDATYSANPDGVIAHLEYLKKLPGRKIIVMPCLIELGKASKEVHRRIGEKIVEVCDLAIIITKDRFKEIKETAGEKAVLIESPKGVFKKIINFIKKDDTVLLESRVPKQVIVLLKIRD